MPYRTKSVVLPVSGKYNGLVKCSGCEFQTKSPMAIKLHMKFVHKKTTTYPKTRKCIFCSEVSPTEREGEAHYKSIHKKHLKGRG